MKKYKQLMAVFMTAIFIAGSFPVTLSAADTRGKVSFVSARSSVAAAEDPDQTTETELDLAGIETDPTETEMDSEETGELSDDAAPEVKEDDEPDSSGPDENAGGIDASAQEHYSDNAVDDKSSEGDKDHFHRGHTSKARKLQICQMAEIKLQ